MDTSIIFAEYLEENYPLIPSKEAEMLNIDLLYIFDYVALSTFISISLLNVMVFDP